MRMVLRCTCICFFILCCKGTVFATDPFETFSGSQFDNDKWYVSDGNGIEIVREVSDGKFISKIRGVVDRPGAGFNTRLRNHLMAADPTTISIFEAKIAYIEGSMEGGVSHVAARLGGYFYEDAGGSVWAEIDLAFDGTNYVVYYGYESSGGWVGGHDTIPFGIQIVPGTEYTVKINLHDSNQLTFSIDGESHTMIGPASLGPAIKEYMLLTTKVYGNGTATGTGYVSATFDDVEVNGSPYDDFSASPVGTHWSNGEAIRKISNGKLQLNVQNVGKTIEDTNLWLDPNYRTEFFQADVTIESSSILTGVDTWAEARVYGALYNDTYDAGSYIGSEGEIWGISRLKYFPAGHFTPEASIFRCDVDDCSSTTTVWSQDFPQDKSCTPQLDTPATLSIHKKENSLVFSCNQEQIIYTIPGSQYPSNSDLKKLRSRVHSTSGQSGYLKATFDNVYTRVNFPWASFLPAIITPQ